jgi:tRNA1(Val) A37 N6-methylase TrmN6
MTAHVVHFDAWRSLAGEQQESIVNQIMARARAGGFPHFRLSREQRLCRFSELTAFDRSTLLKDGVIGASNHGLGLCWHYHPHHWAVKCAGARTAIQTWENDDHLRSAIRKAITQPYFRWSHTHDDVGPYLSPSHLRAALRRASSVQRVSNFRPTAAALLYDRFCRGATWDPCAGFGGRLLGAIASPEVRRYVACDPATQTVAGLRRMIADMAHLTSTACEIHKTPAEEFTPPRREFDLVMTSPPYGRTEVYSDEPTQSCHRYPIAAAWTEGFLRPVIQRAAYSLVPRGRMLLNVANTRQHQTLVDDVERVACEEGFAVEPTLLMAISSVRKGGFKTEPILSFRLR